MAINASASGSPEVDQDQRAGTTGAVQGTCKCRGPPVSAQHTKMHPLSKLFGDFATAIARVAGRPVSFVAAVAVIAVWAATGPIFAYSDIWQLIINTGTTVITFLMVFLIQNSQNRDNAAIQVKLDELTRVSEAQNLFVGIEHLTDEEIDELRQKCEVRARKEGSLARHVGKRRHVVDAGR